MPRRVCQRLRVLPHIRIGVEAQQVALHRVRREEQAYHRVVVACIVIIQPTEGIVVLAGVALVRSRLARVVLQEAKGTIAHVAYHRGRTCLIGDRGAHAAQVIGQEELHGGTEQGSNQFTGQTVVLIDACRDALIVLMLLSIYSSEYVV